MMLLALNASVPMKGAQILGPGWSSTASRKGLEDWRGKALDGREYALRSIALGYVGRHPEGQRANAMS